MKRSGSIPWSSSSTGPTSRRCSRARARGLSRAWGGRCGSSPICRSFTRTPSAVRPSFYVGMGEEDILAVIEETKQRFSVDPDRVYIMGHSMGGYGSSIVGLHYPDHFGGISVGDAAMWGGLPKVPDWMAPQVAIQSVHEALSQRAQRRRLLQERRRGHPAGSRPSSPTASWPQGGFATTEVFPRMPHSFGMQYPYANFVTEVTGHPIKRKPAVGEILYQHAPLQRCVLGDHRPADAAQRRCAGGGRVRGRTRSASPPRTSTRSRCGWARPRCPRGNRSRWSSMAARWRRESLPIRCISRSNRAPGRWASGRPTRS